MADTHQLRNKDGLYETEFLAAYTPGDYERPSVTVDVLVFTVDDKENANYRKLPEKSLELLMIKRGDHPCIGQWALPGGFVNMDENLEDAARRELMEETNVEDTYMEQLYTWGDVGRDPRTRIISCSFLSVVNKQLTEVKSGDDAADAEWFSVSCRVVAEKHQKTPQGWHFEQQVELQLSGKELILWADIRVTKTVNGRSVRVKSQVTESEGIAFDHALAIHCGIERLRSRVEDTDIAFYLMEDMFTLTELQQVYEAILDRKLVKANFRRRVARHVDMTDAYNNDAGHRPSRLYRYNPVGGDTVE